MGTRVFILWSHELFFEGIKKLLDQPGIQLAGAKYDSADASLVMRDLQPEVILVEVDDSESEEIDETLHILDTSTWDPRVIRINLHDNDLVVFHREHRVIKQPSDLLALISERQNQKDQPDV